MITKYTKTAPLHYPTSYRECAEFIRHVVASRRPIAMTHYNRLRVVRAARMSKLCHRFVW